MLDEEPFNHELYERHLRGECHIGCEFCAEWLDNHPPVSPFYGGEEVDVHIPGLEYLDE